MAGLNSYVPLDEVMFFQAAISHSTTSAPTSAAGAVVYFIFEEETTSTLGSGTMTENSNFSGLYHGSATLSAGNGYEVGKWYSIYAQATAGTAGHQVLITFRVASAESTVGAPDVFVQNGSVSTVTGAIGTVSTVLTVLGPLVVNMTAIKGTAVVGTQGTLTNIGTAGTVLGTITASGTMTASTLLGTVSTVNTVLNGTIDANLVAVLSTAAVATQGTLAVLAGSLGGSAVDDVWDEVLTGATHNVQNSAGKRLRDIEAAFIVDEGTLQGAANSTQATLRAGASDVDNIYRGDRIIITAGSGSAEHAIVTEYTGASKVAIIAESWVITPNSTSEYKLSPADVDVETWQHEHTTLIGTLPAVAASTGTVTASTLLNAGTPAVDVRTWLGTAAGGTQGSAAVTGTPAVDIREVKGTAVPGTQGTLQVSVPALTASIATLSAVPAANAGPLDQMQWMYTVSYSQIDQDATKQTVYNPGGTAIATATLSDDAASFRRTKFV